MAGRDPLPPMPPGWMPATEEQVAVLREDINTRMIPRSGPRPVGWATERATPRMPV
jgi:hypothetical protein